MPGNRLRTTLVQISACCRRIAKFQLPDLESGPMEWVESSKVSVTSAFLSGGIDAEGVVAVPGGKTRLCDLRPGDLISTRDGGARVLTALNTVRLSAKNRQRPVVVARGVLGATHLLRLCGDQPVLLSGWLVAALFSAPAVLSHIGAFCNGDHVADAGAGGTYLLPELEDPGLICCNGLWVAATSQSGALSHPLLDAAEEASAAESGIFTRRPGEAHARRSEGELRYEV